MPKIDSLYTLIKSESEKKNRPLKVIADWDECLFSFRATAIFEFADSETPFKEFFEDYWEKAVSEPNDHESPGNPSASRKFIYSGTGEFKEAYDKFQALYKERNKSTNKDADKYKKLHVVDKQHILSTAEDLLRALKEDLISDLKIISASYVINKSHPSNIVSAKRKRFAKTFGLFPQCKFYIQEIEKVNGENKPHRWEWIKENAPDFDIFMDDDDWWIRSVRSHFPSDKSYAINDYKYSRNNKADNIYRIKTTVSDLKDEDFVKVAEEYKAKKAKELADKSVPITSPESNPERETSIWKQPYLYLAFVGGVIVALLGMGIYWWIKKNKSKQK